VVDTSQPSINGSIFDPMNFKNSRLGSSDTVLNPYAKEDPKGYDYVK
jgi:hypothetical protein